MYSGLRQADSALALRTCCTPRDTDWGFEENLTGKWLLLTDGAVSNAKYLVTRVHNGVTERRRTTPDEQAEHEAYLDLEDFQAW